ncbi:hypothetical protein [Kluyvera intermedia]|uniref:hypothetical protein n=1 Tax=Kluyvera intermedia TaxID=61648 RepID=UPI00352578B4
MSKSQKFNASINFGASLDPSMARTLKQLTRGIDDISDESEKAAKTQTAWMRQMKAGSASTTSQIKNMERATETLVKKQAALEKQIRDGVRAGKDVSELASEYQRVAAGIGRAEHALSRLNAQQERETKLADKQQRKQARNERYKNAFLSPAQTAWGKAKAAPGNMLESGLSMAGGLPFAAAKAVFTAPVAIAKMGLATGAGLIGGVLALNKKTAEEYRLAKQYGMSFRSYKAGSILTEQAGLNGENYGDLAEELSNKLGEQGNDKTLNPMLAQIGMNKTQLKGTKQQQFDQVMQAISVAIKNKSMSAQQGESLADQLMGGEANKLMTYIANTGKSYKEVMDNAAQLNNISEDEARAAVESSQTISNIWTSAETALQGIAGELGAAFEPQLKEWEQQATKWIHNNKQLITNEITDWVNGGGPKRVVDGLVKFGDAVSTVAGWISAILPDNDERAPAQMDTIQEARQRALENEAESRGISTAGLSYQEALSIGQRAEQDWKDAHSQARVPDSATFDDSTFGVKVPSLKALAPQQTNHVAIEVSTLPGQDPKEFGQGIYDAFNSGIPQASGASGGGETFDLPSF